MSSHELEIGLFATLRDQLKATHNPNDLERAAIVEAMLQGRGQDLVYQPTRTIKGIRLGRETIGLDGDKVRQLRVERNISQRGLAKLACLTSGYLSQIENGKRDRVSSDAGERIAGVLEVSIVDLRL